MIVAVEQGLEHISKNLRQMGYTVVGPTYGGVVDAFVYTESLTTQSEEHGNTFSMDTIENNINSSSRGILMVNANNKTFEQIQNILQNRLYSPLF